jgi:hypothetical protein
MEMGLNIKIQSLYLQMLRENISKGFSLFKETRRLNRYIIMIDTRFLANPKSHSLATPLASIKTF